MSPLPPLSSPTTFMAVALQSLRVEVMIVDDSNESTRRRLKSNEKVDYVIPFFRTAVKNLHFLLSFCIILLKILFVLPSTFHTTRHHWQKRACGDGRSL